MSPQIDVLNIQFEWDPEKEKLNIAKHGIDFTMAAQVFSDIHRIEKFDYLHSVTEDRFITIGRADFRTMLIAFVVYTERTDVIRIISARPATKKEEEEYFNDDQKNY